MAVYTPLSTDEIQQLMSRLRLGQVTAVTPVAAGVENTTYFIAVSATESALSAPCEYVLTIAETVISEDLSFITALTTHLSQQNLPVPAPIADATGTAVFSLAGKPAVLVPRAPGIHPKQPSIAQCDAIGRALANLHRATQRSDFAHESHRSLHWVAEMGTALLAYLNTEDSELLTQELRFLATLVSTDGGLPQAVIHGDLFRDNTLFLNGKLTAIIDFFSAGTGYLLLDLAVVANDWCHDGTGFSPSHLQALTAAYSAVRTPVDAEINAWPQLLRIAALRFWVSRLAEAHFADGRRPPGSGKDPLEYRQLLVTHRDHPLRWATR